MAKTVTAEVWYNALNDTLYVRILPRRPARMAETGYDFYVRYDWADPSRIVGFEWLDFSSYFGTLDEPGVIPDVALTFDIAGTHHQGLTLKEVLRWAYQHYVLEALIPVKIPAPAMATL